MTEPLFDLKDVSKTFQMGELEVNALRDVNLQIGSGEYVALMGPSGSGKSTFLYLLGLLDRPSAGSYRLDGQDVSRLAERELARVRNRRLGFVFQAFNLLPRTTALENVCLPLEYSGASGRERRRRARGLLDRVGLRDREDHPPNRLSGGQQQRVAIARALVTDPAAILADEPTGNLDSVSAAEVMRLLDELHDEGRTIVLVTHDREVASHADRLVNFRDGMVVEDRRKSA